MCAPKCLLVLLHQRVERCSSVFWQCEFESVNRLKTLPQAGTLLVGCVAGGLMRVDAALAAAGGCVPWVVLLLGRPSRHIPPGMHGQS